MPTIELVVNEVLEAYAPPLNEKSAMLPSGFCEKAIAALYVTPGFLNANGVDDIADVAPPPTPRAEPATVFAVGKSSKQGRAELAFTEMPPLLPVNTEVLKDSTHSIYNEPFVWLYHRAKLFPIIETLSAARVTWEATVGM